MSFLFLSISAVAMAGSGNLIKNGSFEQGLEKWGLWWANGNRETARTGVTDKVRLDGQAALEADMPAGPSRWSISQKVAAKPETDYEFSFHFFTPNDAPGKGMARLSFWDADGKHQGYYAQRSLPPTANVWCDYHAVVTTASNIAAITVELNMYGPGRSYFDSVQLRPLGKGGQRWAALYPDNSPIVLKASRKVPPEENIFPYWSYTAAADRCFKLANAMATPYSLAGEMTEAARHGLAPFYHQWHSADAELAKKLRLAVLYYPLGAVSMEISSQKPVCDYIGGGLHPNDPELVRRVMEKLETEDFRNASPDAPVIFFMRDELYGNSLRFPNGYPNVKSDYWKGMSEAVKRETGFGKYGLPKDPKDTDPFARIAMARYQNELSIRNLRTQHDAFKRRFPRGKIIGCDEWSAVTALDWERLAELIDMQPGQTLHTKSGSNSFATAMLTQFYRYMTGKPVYPFLQIGKYPVAPSTEQLQDIITQGVRSGASGFFVGTVEWYDRGNESPRFAAPDNWRTYLDGVKLVRELGVVPREDDHRMMLHFSSFTQMSLGLEPSTVLPSTYALLGPRCRSCFTFVDDYRIERHAEVLKGYKVLVVPQAKYTTGTILSRFEKAVQDGATLVVFDPDAFMFDIDGTSLAGRREALFGVTTGQSRAGTNVIIDKERLSNPTNTFSPIRILDMENTRVVATDVSGAPVVVEHAFGKGKVWYFSFRLPDNFTVDDYDWIVRLRKWIPLWGGGIDYGFWRWKLDFPRHEPPVERRFECVSGNGMYMVCNSMDTSMNAKAGCRYRYDAAPRAWPDDAVDAQGMVQGGRLLNRLQYAKVRKDASGNFTAPEEMAPERWAVRWGRGEGGPNAITFDFHEPVSVDGVRLFFGGVLPETAFEGSTDGKEFARIGTIPEAQASENAVARAEFFAGSPCAFRFWRLCWVKAPDTELMLSECDFWRKKQGKGN
ncbi:MAG: beta-galactosidase trimerization domain-containing protein [Victivallales bacterium]|nr:beta-galactosidase trimerization domain-containing protein [Victivallales bacterium]